MDRGVRSRSLSLSLRDGRGKLSWCLPVPVSVTVNIKVTVCSVMLKVKLLDNGVFLQCCSSRRVQVWIVCDSAMQLRQCHKTIHSIRGLDGVVSLETWVQIWLKMLAFTFKTIVHHLPRVLHLNKRLKQTKNVQYNYTHLHRLSR